MPDNDAAGTPVRAGTHGRGNFRGHRAAILALGIACLASPGAGQSETLADAMASAYLSSSELRTGTFTVRVLSERAYQARSAGRLQAQGIVNVDATLDKIPGTESSVEAFANFSQPIYTGGRVANATEAAEMRIGAERARRLGTERDVLLDSVAAYGDVRRDRVLIEQARRTIEALSEIRRQVGDQVELGTAQRVDLAQANARLAGAQSDLAQREGDLARSRERYRRVVGAYPGDLAPVPPQPDLPDTLDHAVAIALVHDPAVRAARFERLAAGHEVRTSIGLLLPQIALEAQLGRFDAVGLGNEELGAVLGLRVDIPFYGGGFAYSRVREAQAEVERTAAAVDEEVRNVVQRTGQAWADLAVGRATTRAGEVEVVAAEIAYRGVRDEAELGVRAIADVLDAERELLDARGALVSAERDEYVAGFTLLAAIGKLTVEHLGLDVDPPAAAEDGAVPDRLLASDDTGWSLTYRP